MHSIEDTETIVKRINECLEIILECFEFKKISEIKDGWLSTSNVIGYDVSFSSKIRKEFRLPILKAFIETQELPIRIEDNFPHTETIQIMINE